MNSDRNCTTCKHYRVADSDTNEVPDSGECRAHPPQVVVVSDEAVTLYPQVGAESDCAEWRGSQ